MSSDGTALIAGVSGGRLYVSTNSGTDWDTTKPAGDGDLNWRTTSMSSDGTTLIAGVYGGRLYVSADTGSSWTETRPAGDANKYWLTTSMSSDGTILIAGVDGGRLYISTNSGSTWAETQPAGDADKVWFTTSMSSNATKAIAGVWGGRLYRNNEPLPVELTSFSADVFRSTVLLNWQTATEVNNYGFEVERRGMRNEEPRMKNSEWLKVGFVEGSGTNSSSKSYSFKDEGVAPGRYAYRIKQIDNGGAFTYTMAVEVEIGLLPRELTLAQNYPNPFNPSTTIEFTLAQDGKVVLKVYDLLGREVKTLVNEELKAGVLQRVVFDASELSTGLYFCRL